MTWYQPRWSTSYSKLRRYNAGTYDGSKVRAYCVSSRAIEGTSATTVVAPVPADASGVGGVVTLTGASALVASAVAFGITSLAF
jgi:hypothetical protein